MKKLLLLLILCAQILPAYAANPYKAQTDNAEESFQKGDYAKTIEIYETLVQVEKVSNPYIYYNLANAYYRSGKIGHAVLNIEKAARLAPRDKDIKNNRTLINSAADAGYSAGLADRVCGFYTLNEITAVFSVALCLLAVFLSLFIISRKESAKRITVILFFLLIPLLAGLLLKAYTDIYSTKAVIARQTQARSGPGENNPEVLAVPSGKIVEIADETSDWYRVKIQSGRDKVDGWIEKNKTEII